jgi:hypothetical protein
MAKTVGPVPALWEPRDQAQGKTQSAPRGLAGPIKPLQRSFCESCKSSFTPKRKTARPRAKFTGDVVLEAVRLYIQSLASYRVLATMLERRFGRSVGRVTLNTWVCELGGMAKSPLEVSAELQPQWGEFLGIGGVPSSTRRSIGEGRAETVAESGSTRDF